MRENNGKVTIMMIVITVMVCLGMCWVDASVPTITFEPCNVFSDGLLHLDGRRDNMHSLMREGKDSTHEMHSKRQTFLDNHALYDELDWNGTHLHERDVIERLTADAPLRTDAECANVILAMDPEIDESTTVDGTIKTISIFIKRVRKNPNQDSNKVLWMVNGGPGQPLADLEKRVNPLFNQMTQPFDIYMMEHRGVGRSTRASCLKQELVSSPLPLDIWRLCYESFTQEWGENAKHLNSKAAAIDLAKLIKYINAPKSQNVFVYGVSYGTLLVTRFVRYLELSNQLALVKGVIQDGVVSSKGNYGEMGPFFSFDQFDTNMDQAAREIFKLCNNVEKIKDTTCRDQMNTPDVYQYYVDTMNKVYASDSSCPFIRDNFPQRKWKSVFHALVPSEYTRVMLPALIKRLNRCDSNIDLPVLKKLLAIQTPISSRSVLASTKTVPLISDILKYNIVFSEMWDRSVTLYELIRRYDNLIATGLNVVEMEETRQIANWKVYDLDSRYFNETYGTRPETPVMLLNGDLDPHTPLWSAQAQANNVRGNDRGGLIAVPYGPHAVLISSTQKGSPVPCGLELVVNFIQMDQPDISKIDRSCIDRMYINFKGDTTYNQMVLGVEDIWNGKLQETPTPKDDKKHKYYDLFNIVVGTLSSIVIILFVLLIILGSCLIYLKIKQSSRRKPTSADEDLHYYSKH